MSFHHRVRIRYGEVDQQGVVFNPHYLAYADDAFSRWLAAYDVPFHEIGWDCMVVRAELDWQGSAGYDDELDIAADIERWGTTSFVLRFAMRVGERPVCTALLTYVGVTAGTTNPTPMPEPLKAALIEAAA